MTRARVLPNLPGLAVGLLLLGTACERSSTEKNASQKSAAPEGGPRPPDGLATFEADPNQCLTVHLRARQFRPTARVCGVAGTVRTNLEDLGASEGRLTVDLSTLELLDAKGGIERAWTEEAARWFGTAAAAGPHLATFDLGALHELSHSAARRGERRIRGGQETRQVTAMAPGKLTIRNLAVDHLPKLRLTFLYAGEPAVPVKLDVALERPLRIPLVEHGIKPRSASGYEDSAKALEYQAMVRGFAEVDGQIHFHRLPGPAGAP